MVLVQNCMVLSMFLGWFWPFFYFLCETSTWHLDSCPPEGTWYGVILWVLRVLGQGLIIVRVYFASEFSLLLRHTDEPQKGRNSCLWLHTRYVLSSFGVLLMSCRVKFHIVRSALQYSACRIICLHFSTFFFRQYRPGKCVLWYSRRKKRLSRL